MRAALTRPADLTATQPVPWGPSFAVKAKMATNRRPCDGRRKLQVPTRRCVIASKEHPRTKPTCKHQKSANAQKDSGLPGELGAATQYLMERRPCYRFRFGARTSVGYECSGRPPQITRARES